MTQPQKQEQRIEYNLRRMEGNKGCIKAIRRRLRTAEGEDCGARIGATGSGKSILATGSGKMSRDRRRDEVRLGYAGRRNKLQEAGCLGEQRRLMLESRSWCNWNCVE